MHEWFLLAFPNFKIIWILIQFPIQVLQEFSKDQGSIQVLF